MPSPECHDEDHQGILPKDIAERQRGFRNVVQQGLTLLIVIACVVVWGVSAIPGHKENSAVPQSVQTVQDPTDDDWSAGDAATDDCDDDWGKSDVPYFECLSDHLESFHLITPGLGLCVGDQRFGMTNDHALILYSKGETYMMHQDMEAFAFQMTDQGYFQFLDIDNRVLWEAIPRIDITPMPSCGQSLSQDCPQLQLQENGDLVLNSVNKTDIKVQVLFPYLFRTTSPFQGPVPSMICIVEMLDQWLGLMTGQGICSDEQSFGVTDDGALVVHSNGVTTVLYQNKLAKYFQFTEHGHLILRDGNFQDIWEASPTVELTQPTKESLFPVLRFDQNGMFVATIVTNNSTFTSYNFSDIFPDLFL